MARGKKNPTDPVLDEMRIACTDERRAVEFFEAQRWGDTPCCPRCGDTNVYQVRHRNGERHKHFRWVCRGCKQFFSVRTDSVMEETRLPMKHWLFTFWQACASKKGVSALQISRECQISYTSALYLMHRVRTAMDTRAEDMFGEQLTGTVEVDELYAGGAIGNNKRARGNPKARGSGARAENKTPIIAMVQRGGQVRLRAVDRVTGENLERHIMENVDARSRLMTDELKAYRRIGRKFAGGHQSVRHSYGEYARGDAHVNTAESCFSLLRRGLVGVYHQTSRWHLPKYCAEFQFRWNARHLTDSQRTVKAIRQSEGKRLRYREASAA